MGKKALGFSICEVPPNSQFLWVEENVSVKLKNLNKTKNGDESLELLNGYLQSAMRYESMCKKDLWQCQKILYTLAGGTLRFWGPRLQPTENIGKSGTESRLRCVVLFLYCADHIFKHVNAMFIVILLIPASFIVNVPYYMFSFSFPHIRSHSVNSLDLSDLIAVTRRELT